MTRPISDREWQELSAYLDGQLSARETARLEQRLQQHSDLRAAYQDLRRVRHLLRSQPRLRAPRNFTLSAQTAGVSPRRRSDLTRGPAFGFVSALATVMLVLFVVGELLVTSPRMAAQPVAMEAQLEAAETEALPMLQAEEDSSKLMPLQPTPAEGLRALPPQEAASESDDITTTAPQALEAAPMEYPAPENPVEGAQETQALSMAAEESANAAQDTVQEQPISRQTFWNGWRIAQVILLLIAVTSGAAAIFLRLRRNL